MLKKILSIVVCACVTVEMTSTILASEQINVNENLSKVKCEANISDIIDIPIFIVNSETNITEDIKEDINKSIDEYSGNKAYEFTDKSNEKEIIKDNYTINELTDNEKIDVVNNDLFSETFSQVKRMKENGIIVKNIKFYSKESNGIELMSDKMNDPAYWEKVANYLGKYNGYKFLYMESSLAVKTDVVELDKTNALFDWGKFLTSIASSSMNMVVDGISTEVSIVKEAISNIMGSMPQPVKVKIKDASESELKTYLEGDVYIRTVLIRDLDNRVEGYAYYPWGTTGQSILKQWVDIKYPTRKKSKTTYYYDTRKKFSKKINTKTPGFSGNQSYLDKIYNLYKNKWGQFYDKETLDIGSITASILEQ